MVILPAWWLYTLRLGAILLALASVRGGIHGLLGRPLVVAGRGGRAHTVSGCASRAFGLLAFLCAWLVVMFAFKALGH